MQGKESESCALLEGVVHGSTDPRPHSEFYRQLLGFTYRAGDEPPLDGQPDEKGRDWLVLSHESGKRLAFQHVASLKRSTWPSDEVPQQLHLDIRALSMDDFEHHHQRALELGARVLFERLEDKQEPLRVYADPDGHPFCIFVWPNAS